MTTKKIQPVAEPAVDAALDDPALDAELEPQSSWSFEPVGDHLVVEPIPEGERKVGRLVIPDTAKERPSVGLVVAVNLSHTQALAPGDRVVYGKYSGHELTIDDRTYIVLKSADILTKLVEGPPLALVAVPELEQAPTPASRVDAFPDATEEEPLP